MRWFELYLVAYFILLAVAAWTLWESGVLAEIPGVWIAITAVVTVSAGILLAIVFLRPSTPRSN